MTLYLVAYELHEGKDDSNIADAIRQFRTHIQFLKSSWLIITEQTAENVFDFLCPHIVQHDKLTVLPIDTSPNAGAFWANLGDQATAWLEKHL